MKLINSFNFIICGNSTTYQCKKKHSPCSKHIHNAGILIIGEYVTFFFFKCSVRCVVTTRKIIEENNVITQRTQRFVFYKTQIYLFSVTYVWVWNEMRYKEPMYSSFFCYSFALCFHLLDFRLSFFYYFWWLFGVFLISLKTIFFTHICISHIIYHRRTIYIYTNIHYTLFLKDWYNDRHTETERHAVIKGNRSRERRNIASRLHVVLISNYGHFPYSLSF